jgi:hypothetical protein
MSAIYGDPTLGANLKFVILRLIFYEGAEDEAVPISRFMIAIFTDFRRKNWLFS